MHPQDLESRIRHQLVMIEQSMAAARPKFMAKEPMEWHTQSHLTPELSPAEPYGCDECGRRFAVPARLARHLRTHTGEKPHVCDICQKGFSVRENLLVHLRTHTQERPYTCTVCTRSFEHSGKLHRHMRIHTGERPHRCVLCSKTFIQSGQLVIHMRTHTGEKPYVCSTCSKGFTCSKQLKVHMRTHTGEKPYSCDICGKSFGYNHVLKLHQVAHFGEKVYKCTLCKTTLSSKKQLESHIKSHEEGLAEMLYSPRPSSSSSCSSSHSDKENSACLFRPSLPALSPALSQTSDPMDAQFILPSIHSIVSAVPTLTLRPTAQLTRNGSPVYPVTPSLVRSLLAADREQFGPPAPLPSPALSPEIYAKCLVTAAPRQVPASPGYLTAPASPASPASSPPCSIASMNESSLPLRKRRHAYSECYSSEDCLSPKAPSTPSSISSPPSPASPPLSPPSPTPRTSVIVFAAHRN